MEKGMASIKTIQSAPSSAHRISLIQYPHPWSSHLQLTFFLPNSPASSLFAHSVTLPPAQLRPFPSFPCRYPCPLLHLSSTHSHGTSAKLSSGNICFSCQPPPSSS